MKSKASIKGHPLHPILVSFPIAFFIGSLIFDIMGQVYERHDFHTTAMYLQIAGIAAGLLAAVPGIVDFIAVVPPRSSGKKRAVKHGIINTLVLVVFGIVLWLRQQEDFSWTMVIALEIAAIIGLSVAGWLGGTLVYRNQIGVDIRYAHAGKWKELRVADDSGRIHVADTSELKVNQMKLVHVGGNRIVVCKTEKGYAAFDDHCTHRGASLAAGSMICGTVQCPWHGSQFNVYNGTVTAGPAKEKIDIYTLEESGGKVFLILSKGKT